MIQDQIDVPDDYTPPPSAAPHVGPNPNEDPHKSLRKATRQILSCLDLITTSMEGQSKISSDDDRVHMLEALSFAVGLIEGYIEGSEWRTQ